MAQVYTYRRFDDYNRLFYGLDPNKDVVFVAKCQKSFTPFEEIIFNESKSERIVSSIGKVTIRDRECMKIPYAKYGDLFDFEVTKDNVDDICNQCIEAVRDLHKMGFYHMDIKPDNFLVFSINPIDVKISDFEFVTDKCESNRYIGTPNFMPPEVEEKRTYSPQISDSWSLGCTLGFLILKAVYGKVAFSQLTLFDQFILQKVPSEYIKRYELDLLLEENPKKRKVLVDINKNCN
jgi:serine/threonine protein kinase